MHTGATQLDSQDIQLVMLVMFAVTGPGNHRLCEWKKCKKGRRDDCYRAVCAAHSLSY